MNEYIELRPFEPPEDILDEVEKIIRDVLRREIYGPIVDALKDEGIKIKNSDPSDPMSIVSWALQKGTITYNRGRFSGKFEANISRALRKLGATWDGSDGGSFRILLRELPDSITQAIQSSTQHFERKLSVIDSTLEKLSPEKISKSVALSNLFDKSIWRVDSNFRKNVKSIAVAPQLNDKQRADLADEWQNEVRLQVKDKAQEEISRLRGRIQKSAFAGNRYGALIKTVKTSIGVSDSRAKFIAKQETKLLMAKHNELQLRSVGVFEYRWKCVTGTKAHPVRPRHKKLSEMSDAGKVFRFDDPPIVSEPGQKERRANPQEDFNCRCRAIPVFRPRAK